MKFRHALMLLVAGMLVVAGCGSDSDEKKSDDTKKLTKQEQAAKEDQENKTKRVDEAEDEFKKNSKDVGACRNLAMAWIAKASPASSADPKEPPKLPEDREESLDKAVSTLEDCVKIDGKDRDVQQMLASTYMATNDYDQATPLLKQLAASAKGDERPNAYYAWGLAASNANEYDDAISAWTMFVKLAPKKDPRIAQVRQSISALKTAQKQAAATPAADDSADEEADSGDEG